MPGPTDFSQLDMGKDAYETHSGYNPHQYGSREVSNRLGRRYGAQVTQTNPVGPDGFRPPPQNSLSYGGNDSSLYNTGMLARQAQNWGFDGPLGVDAMHGAERAYNQGGAGLRSIMARDADPANVAQARAIQRYSAMANRGQGVPMNGSAAFVDQGRGYLMNDMDVPVIRDGGPSRLAWNSPSDGPRSIYQQRDRNPNAAMPSNAVWNRSSEPAPQRRYARNAQGFGSNQGF